LHTIKDRGLKLWTVGVALLLGLMATAVVCWQWRLTGAVGQARAETEWFSDVTEKVGLDFVHDAGPAGTFFMPQIIGSGAALFDFDGDGRLDIYLLTNAGPKSEVKNRLYKNMPDGTFKDVSIGSGLDIDGYSMGVAIGDIDNDGLPDVLVTQFGGIKLFLNRGDGKFEDVTAASGLVNPLWATSASFFDYDRDGWLDLVVVNYLDYDPSWVCKAANGDQEYCHPKVFHGTVTRLFRNRGADLAAGKAGPRFEDVTVAAGLARVPGPGLGVTCADFDGDGWPDILVANDDKPNHRWVNQRDGTFTEEAFARGLAVDAMGHAQGNMGIVIGDVNNDGRFDVYISHLTSELNTLWLQGPQRGLFQDRTAAAKLINSDWRGTGFGTLMADFDHDGWLDIAVVNGRVARGTQTPNVALGRHWQHYSERNQLWRNEGQGRFRDISRGNSAFCGTPNVARGLAVGDLDGDGAPDLLVTTVAGPARILRNCVQPRGHWLLVRALDPRLKRDAYGAELTVRAGSERWLRIVNPGGSYLCSSDPRVHVGLGTAARYDEITVHWPDGLVERFAGGQADQAIVLHRGEGQPAQKQ
jgi:enediyne biosynthesis protein E4